MKITIETIPHDQQRIAGQVGDWQWLTKTELLIRVSTMHYMQYDMAVAVHEFVEAMLCWDADIDGADVDAFDREWNRFGDVSEPGDHPAAPYARQHCFATAVERMLIAAFGISWAEYEAAVEALP